MQRFGLSADSGGFAAVAAFVLASIPRLVSACACGSLNLIAGVAKNILFSTKKNDFGSSTTVA